MAKTKKRTNEQKRKYPQYRNINAPQGKHWCGYHQRYEPRENFSKSKEKVHGLNNKCREGQAEYLKEYTKKYGNSTVFTKTIRVTPKIHEFIKQRSKITGVSMARITHAAIKFHAKYGCTYDGCLNPRTTEYGRCDKHILSINPGSNE